MKTIAEFILKILDEVEADNPYGFGTYQEDTWKEAIAEVKKRLLEMR